MADTILTDEQVFGAPKKSTGDTLTDEEVFGAAPVLSAQDKPPQALLDRFMGGTSVGRVLSSVGKGIAVGWGDESLGLSDDTITKLQDAHLFANPKAGTPGYLWPIEQPLRILAPGVEALGRAFNAGLTGFAEGVGQTAEEVGESPAMAARMKRDLVEMGNVAALLAGTVNPIKRPVIDATGKAHIEVLGNLPKAQDFEATARAFAPDGPTMVNGKLTRLYQEQGIVPAEVFSDARRDVTIAQDLLADNVSTPRAYKATLENASRETQGAPGAPGAQGTPSQAPAAPGGVPPTSSPPRAPSAPSAPTPPPGSPAAAQATVLSKISVGEHSPRVWSWDQFYTAAIDDLFPINKAVKQSGLDMATAADPYRLSRLTRGAPAKANMMITRNTFDWNTYQTNGAGLKEIIEPVKKDLDGLRAYIASKRAVELSDRGIEAGIDIAAARQVIADGTPKYGRIQEELVAYQDRLTQYLRDSGLLSDEAYDAMRAANRDYVPFFRVMDEEFVPGSGLRGAVRNPIKKIKGSERAVIDPLESIIKNTYLYVNMAERNAAARAFIEMADNSGNPGAFYEFVAKPVRPTTVAQEEMDRYLASQGISGMPADLLTVFRAHAEPLAKDEIAVFSHGKREVIRTDPAVAEAFKQMDRQSADLLTRMFALPSRTLRAGATLSPDFMARNVIRDFFMAFVNSRGIFTPIDTAKGLAGVIRKDADWEQWIRGGGAHATMVAMDRNYLQKNLGEIVGEKGVGKQMWNVVRSPIDALRVASELAENSTRLGEFKKVRAMQERAGIIGKAATQEAAFRAREVTLDFSRMGAKMRAFNMITAFANAQIQGVDRVVRAFKDNPMATTIKVGAGITIPAVLLWWANRDEPRYKEIPNWEKDMYWIVMTGYGRPGDPGYEPGHIYRVPKPFEIGVIFGSAVERSLDAYVNHNPDAYKQLTDSIVGALTPSTIPTAAVPVLEQFANRSSFTGRNLIPAPAERLLPEYQYTPYTTELAKRLGEIFGAFPGIREGRTSSDLNAASFVSRALSTPVLIENYVQAWSGGLGRYALMAADAGLRKAGVLPDPPTPAWSLSDIPVVKAFVVRYPSASTQSIQDFYDAYARDAMYFNTWMAKAKEGDMYAMDRIQSLGGPAMFLQMDAMKTALAEHSQLVKNIWKNPDMKPDEKRQIIDTAYYNMIKIAQAGNMALRKIHERLGEPPP